jgi:hypothetical protein
MEFSKDAHFTNFGYEWDIDNNSLLELAFERLELGSVAQLRQDLDRAGFCKNKRIRSQMTEIR